MTSLSVAALLSSLTGVIERITVIAKVTTNLYQLAIDIFGIGFLTADRIARNETICDLIEHYLPQAGFNPATDVQVLCPMTRRLVSTRNLNKVLQQLINPPSEDQEELVRGDSILRIGDWRSHLPSGDRMMQLKNDYNKEVFNGDLGIFRVINKTEKEVNIDFDSRDVTYNYADLNEITL